LGKTYENRHLTFVQVGKCTNCPAIFIEAGIHAREWLGPPVALNIIDQLVNNSSNHLYATKLKWFILPISNPDGYAYTHSKERLWRKNRHPAPANCLGSKCGGVDLNRNFDYDWNGTNSITNPGADAYQGPTVASEPETKAIVEFVEKHLKQIRSYLSIHSYGQLFMYTCPVGTSGKCFDKDSDVVKLANKVTDAIKSEGGRLYKVGSPEEVLAITGATGSSDLWARYSKRIPFTFTVELRPPDENQGFEGFKAASTEITPASKELWAGYKVIADALLQKYPEIA